MNQTSSATVCSWLAHPLSAEVKRAIERLARTDDAKHVAVMPDVHLSREVCVGTVLATSRLIYPAAVGGDIGCGMAAVAFNATADVLSDEQRAARLLRELARSIPAIRHPSRQGRELPPSLDPAALSDPRLASIARRDGIVQLGTLGRGNHFLEFQADEEDRLWLMVHSGSRAMGPAIRDWHLAKAATSTTGLRYLDAETESGRAYVSDMQWAREYAAHNRTMMVNAAANAAMQVLDAGVDQSSWIACDHNHVREEKHFDCQICVHRKGAMPAAAGEMGILPGSMGTESYHIEGRGCEQSLCSSAHGAGRAMSRDEARRKITSRDVSRQLRSVWFDHRLSAELREESPAAYKDVRAVLRAQRELVRIVRKLRPILVYKTG